jgi:hypothetical protein
MNEHRRRQAFAVAVVVVAVAVGVLWVLGPRNLGGGSDEPPAPPVVQGEVSEADAGTKDGGEGDAAPATGSSSDPDRQARMSRREADEQVRDPKPPVGVPEAIERAGRRFLDAYLRFEVGGDSRAVRAALRGAATPPLVRYLTGQPQRRPPGAEVPEKATINALRILRGPQQDPQRRTLIATIDRDGVISPLELEVEQRGGRWLVASVG